MLLGMAWFCISLFEENGMKSCFYFIFCDSGNLGCCDLPGPALGAGPQASFHVPLKFSPALKSASETGTVGTEQMWSAQLPWQKGNVLILSLQVCVILVNFHI